MRTALFCLLVAAVVCWTPGCKEEPRSTNDGLKGGINYMQPFRWRMTYHYRVQEITPERAYIKPRPSAWDPMIDAVGNGTFQVWFVGPRPGEEIRDVKLISASPEPTEIAQGIDTDVEYFYYDFAPDGGLPREIDAKITWEFITFERYAFWKGMNIEDYDKDSEFYREYTKEESPIRFHHEMKKVVDKIKEEADGDLMQTALGCYNYIIMNFDYDWSSFEWVTVAGGTALFDSFRAWENQAGVCDEFATTLCAMLRYAGIPARPVAGIVHPVTNISGVDDDKTRKAMIRVTDRLGPLLSGGGHAWTEFFFPGVGWIPADATWGQVDFNIDKHYSYLGSKREIPIVDYYFGKHDPFRIAWFKDWNYTLNPPSKASGNNSEGWMFCYTDRTSGIREMKTGWTGIGGMNYTRLGWARSVKSAGSNFDVEIQDLGPVADGEIPEVIAAIEEEGGHYLRVPGVPGRWPRWTMGMDRGEEIAQDYIDQVIELDRELERDDVSAMIADLIKDAVER
jgi:transglutaminase-like putative cysteine protease